MKYILYHGTNKDFDLFDTSKSKYVGCNGDGLYFASNKNYAKTYGKNIKKVSVTILNPLTPETNILTLKNYKKILLHIWKNTEFKEDLKNYGYFKDSDFKNFMTKKAKELYNKKNDYNAFFDLVHTSIGSLKELLNIVKIVNNIYFDGVISKNMDEYVIFNNEQIKILN